MTIRRRLLLVLASALAAVVAVASEEGPAPGTSDLPVHADPAALEDAMLEAERAVLRDDVEALVPALEAIAARTRRLERGAAGRYEPIRSVDHGFHVALETASEAARAGNLQEAVGQTYWVSVGCRKCHVEARKAGLLPNAPLLRDE